MDKINITQAQLNALEMLVVAYMVAAENTVGLSKEDAKALVYSLDVAWDAKFKVVK